MQKVLVAKAIPVFIFTARTRQIAVFFVQKKKEYHAGNLTMMIWPQKTGLSLITLAILKRRYAAMDSTRRQSIQLRNLKEEYQCCPIWIAVDYYGQPKTFGGWIQTDLKVDYVNAQSFIYSQLVQMDRISTFTNFIGRDGQETAFLKDLAQNDRNMSFWINLAKKWFKAEWMANCNEQL